MSSNWSVRIATSVFGAAVAIGIAPALQGRAHPGDVPGAMAAEGLSPNGPFLQLAALILAVVIFGALGEIAARRLAGIRWATISYCATTASAPLALMHFGTVRHVLLHGA